MTEHCGEVRREAQIRAPDPGCAGLPETKTLLVGSEPRQLLSGVRHVKRLVFENAGEKLSGLRIGVQHLCVSGEAACRRLLGEMQECEERLIGFFFYPQVIEPAFARRHSHSRLVQNRAN